MDLQVPLTTPGMDMIDPEIDSQLQLEATALVPPKPSKISVAKVSTSEDGGELVAMSSDPAADPEWKQVKGKGRKKKKHAEKGAPSSSLQGGSSDEICNSSTQMEVNDEDVLSVGSPSPKGLAPDGVRSMQEQPLVLLPDPPPSVASKAPATGRRPKKR